MKMRRALLAVAATAVLFGSTAATALPAEAGTRVIGFWNRADCDIARGRYVESYPQYTFGPCQMVPTGSQNSFHFYMYF